jgi:hypothetical protein
MIWSVVNKYDPFAVATQTAYFDSTGSVTSGTLGLSLQEDINSAANAQ